jgi:hypothetical protein
LKTVDDDKQTGRLSTTLLEDHRENWQCVRVC